jgi:peptide/nickel transport system substrate-binding protein
MEDFEMKKLNVLVVVMLSVCFVFSASSLFASGKEAPMLTELVKAGKLPPLEERLPENPLVEVPVSEIGTYGDKLILGTAFFLDDERLPVRVDRNGFFQFTYPFPAKGPILPNLAESWDWNADGTELIIHLRKGIKWSDGVPFTAEDVVFFMEDIVNNEKVAYIWFYEGNFYDANGNFPKLTKIDDYTLKFEYDDTAFLFEKKYSNVCWAALPKHHFTQWHPKYNADSSYQILNEKLKILGVNSEGGRVTLDAWIIDEYVPDEKLHMTRNPYYWKVDPKGNQLPYFDEFEILIAGDRPSVGLGNMIGEYDHDHMWTGYPHYSMWLEEQGKPGRDYSIGFSNAPGMKIAFNYDAADPEARAVLRNVNFRRAISLAIDRPTISKTLAFDLMTPIGCAWAPDSPYFDKDSGYLYSEYDPVKARKILDDAGITDRNGDGIRELPTGEKLELVWDMYAHDLFTPMSEMIVATTKEVGIKLVLNEKHQTLHTNNYRAGNFEMTTEDFEFYNEPLLAIEMWVPTKPGSPYFHKNGFKQGGFSPEYDEYTKILKKASISNIEDGIKLGKQASRIMAENVFQIHVGVRKRPFINSNRLGNMVLESTRVQEYGNFDPPFRYMQVYAKYPAKRP